MKQYWVYFLLGALLLGMNLPLQAEEEDVILVYFLAETDPDGVRLEWETASEVDVAGFRIKRADQSAGPYEMIDVIWNGQTVDFIPASGMFPTGGAVYEIWDVAAAGSQTYWYKLVVENIAGLEEEHGPVSAVSGSTPSPLKLFIPLLSTSPLATN